MSRREQRRAGLRWALGLGVALAAAPGAHAVSHAALLHEANAAVKPRRRLHERERVMLALGTAMSLRVAHAEIDVAERALGAAVAAVQRVDAALSLFRDDSALVSLNRLGVLDPAPVELVRTLRAGLDLARETEGAFDPTIQPLWRTWFEAHLQQRVPSPRAIQAARRFLGWRDVSLGSARIALGARGRALTLNGIAQGVAADRAGAALREHGIAHALVDTGEWLAWGRAPDDGPWRLGVAAPGGGSGAPRALLARLQPDGRALACSADDRLTFTSDGSEHHILDPRTGHSPRALALVVIAAGSAARADALSKPVFLAGSVDAALARARRLGVDALAVDKTGRWGATAGMPLARMR
jgi:thiamine biosynthesis lipoprotein